jgi:hypothetical protein
MKINNKRNLNMYENEEYNRIGMAIIKKQNADIIVATDAQ